MKSHKPYCLSALLPLLLTGCNFDFNKNKAASIGIIGGADGPTAVYVTSKLSPLGAVLLAVGGVAVVALIVWLVYRHNHKK